LEYSFEVDEKLVINRLEKMEERDKRKVFLMKVISINIRDLGGNIKRELFERFNREGASWNSMHSRDQV